MKEFKFLIGILLFSAFLFSCSNNNSSKKAAEAVDDVSVEDLNTAVENMPMPSSYEIIQTLNKSGAGYIFDITNPPANVENYVSYKQKAINLGIYAADLTYTTTYQKKDETAMYLDNFVQLVGDLEITTLDRNFFQRVQNNLDNKDSLIIIIKEAQYNTQKFLNKSGKNEIALYALTGSWVEGMYLVGATLKFAEDKQPLFNIIIDYKKSLQELIKLMEKYKDDENFKDLYSSLKELDNLFGKVKSTDDIKNIEALKDKIINFRNTLV